MAACGRPASWRVFVATFFVACQAHRVNRVHTDSKVVETSDDEAINLFVASAVLKWALVSKNAAQGAVAVYDHYRNKKQFEDTSRAAIEDLDRLLSMVAVKGGLTRGEVLRSQYLELEVLRDRFDEIKKFCQPSKGLLHILVSMVWGDIEPQLAANISGKIDDVQAQLSNIADNFFCSHFEEVLSRELTALGTLLRDWEVASSRSWYPRRSLPNRVLARKSFETLTQEYGLSKREAKHVKWMEVRSAVAGSVGGDPWIHLFSDFQDTLLSDTGVPNANKTAVEAGLREVRVLFSEMSRVSTQCHARSRALWCKHAGFRAAEQSGCQLAEQENSEDAPLAYPLCERCPSCCRLQGQTWPWLAYIQQHLEEYQEELLHFYDVSAFSPSPSSFLWIAVRLATSGKGKHGELCGAVWKLLQGESVSQAEVPSFDLGDTRKAVRPQGDDRVSLLIPELRESFSDEEDD